MPLGVHQLDPGPDHDHAGNVVATEDANGLDVGYTYGRLAKVTDGSGSTAWCYNRFGDLVRKVQATNGKVFGLAWSYGPDGRLAMMQYPDGTVLYYTHDAQGRVSSITRSPDGLSDETLLSDVHYAPFGPVQRWDYGNGLEHRRSVNLDYRPGFIEDGPQGTPGPGLNLGYVFDAVGNLQTLNAADQFTVKRHYTHDRQNRLTKVEDASLADLQTYAYDATGNRTSSTNGVTSAYAYLTGTHRLTSVAGVTRGYDRNLPRQADSAKGEFARSRISRKTLGGRFPSDSCGRSSL